jgi:peptidyl-prolyl cis-trans isomerase D
MLATLRRHYKYFLIATAVLVIPTFIMWGGPGRMLQKRPGEEEVARVNGTPITAEELAHSMAAARQRLRAALGENYDPDMFEGGALVQRVLNDLVTARLVSQEVDRLRIRVSHEAVEEWLRNQPQFFEDGKFNAEEYNAFVSRTDIPWDSVYEDLRRSIRLDMLVAGVESVAKLSEPELREEYRLRNDKVKVKYLAFTPSQFEDEVTVTDEEIQQYYAENQQSFIEPEKIRVQYVTVPIAPSDSDREAVLEKARDVLAKARAGEDFAELAERYSEEPQASENAGDMGWREERLLSGAIASAVSELKEGDLSDVVETERQQVCLLKCEGRKEEDGTTQVKLRQIVFDLAPSEETQEKLASQIDAVMKAAHESKSLVAAAEKLGMEVEEAGPFSERDRFLPAIGMDSQEFVRTAFWLQEQHDQMQEQEDASEEPTDISDVMITRNAYYVMQLAGRTERGLRELSEVEAQIRNAVMRRKGLALAHTKATELASRLTSLDQVKQVDEELAASVKESEPFTRTGYVPGVPGERDFFNAAFALEPGKLSPPVLGRSGAYLLEVVERIPVDEKQFEEDKEQFREQLVRQKVNMLTEDWQWWLQARADVRFNEKLLAEMAGG